MKHQQSVRATKPPIHAARKRHATSARVNPAVIPSTAEAAESRDRAIRETAYAFYEARGRVDGHELDDWFQAEAEVDRAALAESVESFDDLVPERE